MALAATQSPLPAAPAAAPAAPAQPPPPPPGSHAAAAAAPARSASTRFKRGPDERRSKSKREPKRSTTKHGAQQAHSKGMGQICKAAVSGSIRGQGSFVVISFSPHNNINYFCTREDGGIGQAWLDPELQAWLQSRRTGEPCPPTVGRAPFPEESIIMGRCDTLKTRGKRGGQTLSGAPDMSD